MWVLIVSVPDYCLSFYSPCIVYANSDGSGESARIMF